MNTITFFTFLLLQNYCPGMFIFKQKNFHSDFQRQWEGQFLVDDTSEVPRWEEFYLEHRTYLRWSLPIH